MLFILSKLILTVTSEVHKANNILILIIWRVFNLKGLHLKYVNIHSKFRVIKKIEFTLIIMNHKTY